MAFGNDVRAPREGEGTPHPRPTCEPAYPISPPHPHPQPHPGAPFEHRASSKVVGTPGPGYACVLSLGGCCMGVLTVSAQVCRDPVLPIALWLRRAPRRIPEWQPECVPSIEGAGEGK